MKIFKIAQLDYTEVGHDANKYRPVILWIMHNDGTIESKETRNTNNTHSTFFGDINIINHMCGGRYVPQDKECSIYYIQTNMPDELSPKFAVWVKSLLKEKFKNIDRFYEFDKPAELLAKTNSFVKMSQCYLDIGHKPSKENPVYLWAMNTNGRIIAEETDDPMSFHNSFLGIVCSRYMCVGRYDVNSHKCSIHYYLENLPDDFSIRTANWIKSILSEEFGNVSKFYEFNKPPTLLAKNNYKIFKIAQSDKDIDEPELAGYNPDESDSDTAPVNWHQKDIQMLATWDANKVKEFLSLSDDAFVYKALIPIIQLNETLTEEDLGGLSGEDAEHECFYDWSELQGKKTSPPPIVVTRKQNGSIVINDGNHRVRFWSESGYQYAPAWVYDEMLTLKSRKKKTRYVLPKL